MGFIGSTGIVGAAASCRRRSPLAALAVAASSRPSQQRHMVQLLVIGILARHDRSYFTRSAKHADVADPRQGHKA